MALNPLNRQQANKTSLMVARSGRDPPDEANSWRYFGNREWLRRGNPDTKKRVGNTVRDRADVFNQVDLPLFKNPIWRNLAITTSLLSLTSISIWITLGLISLLSLTHSFKIFWSPFVTHTSMLDTVSANLFFFSPLVQCVK